MRLHRICAALLILAATMTWAFAQENGREPNHKLYAVPAPKNVVIDGKLDDWDWSGHIYTYVRSATQATQSAELAIMYDNDALYVGAKVKDSSPMLNRHDPAADADKAWMGDCLQLRLVTDRRLAFPYVRFSGTGDHGEPDGQPLHLMLWYYTDGKEPALQIHKTMSLLPVRPEWAPHGVVPHDHFSAAYRIDEDGQGYTLEYRIPWDTLNAKDCHPVAGDIITATAQFLWGDDSGLNNVAQSYDLMSAPGFPWQSTNEWGKMIFSDKGNVSRNLIDPVQKLAPPQPLTFDYDLPADGDVSIALYDKDNRIVRHIVAQQPRKAGHITEHWDGLDSAGKPLPVGKYTWKGLYHDPITTRYVMSLGNSGQPGWKTADGTGGWGGDYGPPTAACVAGDTMILGWNGHEAGWGIIATDLNGKKKWGLRQKNATLLATDGKRFFANGEGGGQQINVYAVANGQPMVYGNERQGLEPPPGGDATSNAASGVAYNAGTLYVSYGGRNAIGVYDAVTGNLKTTWSLDKPGRLVVGSDDVVYAVSGTKVVRIANGAVSDFATEHIDVPAGIAIDSAGQVYVANGGALEDVSVFTPSGKYLREIGRVGGRAVLGKYNPEGMLEPAGIAVDGEGKLWVPEAVTMMKRLSVWNTNKGGLIKEFFGGCSYSPFAWIDPANPHEAFFDNTIWKIDLEKGTWYPKSTAYHQKNDNALNAGNGGFFYPYRVFTARNGHQYAVSFIYGFGPVLWLREGDTFRPLHYLFRNRPNPVLLDEPAFAFMEDRKAYPAGQIYSWTDTNGDQVADASEITIRSDKTTFFDWMDDDLNLYGQGSVYHPTSVDNNGVPSYNFDKPQAVTTPAAWYMSTDPKAKAYWGWSNGWFGRSNADGTTKWSYDGLKAWYNAINDGLPKPGTLVGATCLLGIAGRYSGLVSYFCSDDIVRDDGLYVAQLFESGAKGNNGPNVFYVEFLAGQLVQPNGGKKVYVLGGDQDCRILEVKGLDTVKDISGGVYDYTDALAAQSARAFANYNSKVASSRSLILSRGGLAGLATADSVGKTIDDKRGFEVKVSYDDKNLYFRYSVSSPSAFTNGMTDPYSIYKGGNLADILIASNRDADPSRTKPAVGDMRLLVSMRDGKPWAVLMRPKVAGFTGDPIKLTSPQGAELFESIAATDRVDVRDYNQQQGSFVATIVVPLDLVGLSSLSPGDHLGFDVGYIFGDAGGLNTGARAYWHNNSFAANVVNDIPSESRLEPEEWGTALAE